MNILSNINQFFVIVPNLIAVPLEQKDVFLGIKEKIIQLQKDKEKNALEIKLCFQQLKSLAYHYYSNTNGNYVAADDAMYEVHLHKPQWFEAWKRLSSTASKLYRIQEIVKDLAVKKQLSVQDAADGAYQRVINTLRKRLKENLDNETVFAELYIVSLCLHCLLQNFSHQANYVRENIKEQDDYALEIENQQKKYFVPNTFPLHEYKCFINLIAPTAFVYDMDLTLNNRNKENDFVLQFLLSYFPKPQSSDASIV